MIELICSKVIRYIYIYIYERSRQEFMINSVVGVYVVRTSSLNDKLCQIETEYVNYSRER